MVILLGLYAQYMHGSIVETTVSTGHFDVPVVLILEKPIRLLV